MLIQYNSVPMKVVLTNRVSRRHRYTPDHMSYLYTDWTFDVLGALNAKAAMIASAVFGQQQGSGDNPYSIDEAIRGALQLPSRSLVVTSEEVGTQLISVDSSSDAKAGPFPEVFGIERIFGTKTFIVRFRVRAHVIEVNPDPSIRETLQFILSHRWNSVESVDQDHYPAREISGRAYLHAGRLFGGEDVRAGQAGAVNGAGPGDQNIPIMADQFRSALFHPIANGYRRTNIVVTPASDNSHLDYSFTDVLDPIKWVTDKQGPFLPIPCTRVYADHASMVNTPEQGLAWKIKGWVDRFNKEAGGNFENPWEKTKEWRSVQEAGRKIERAIAEFERRRLTKHTQTIIVKAFGDATTKRTTLINMCAGIAYGRLQYYVQKYAFTPAHETDLIRDLTGKMVELRVSIHTGPATQLFSQLAPYDDEPDQSEEVRAKNGQLLLTPNAVAPQYRPGVKGTRASPQVRERLIALVTQTLENPGSPPPTVPQTTFISTRPDL